MLFVTRRGQNAKEKDEGKEEAIILNPKNYENDAFVKLVKV